MQFPEFHPVMQCWGSAGIHNAASIARLASVMQEPVNGQRFLHTHAIRLSCKPQPLTGQHDQPHTPSPATFHAHTIFFLLLFSSFFFLASIFLTRDGKTKDERRQQAKVAEPPAAVWYVQGAGRSDRADGIAR